MAAGTLIFQIPIGDALKELTDTTYFLNTMLPCSTLYGTNVNLYSNF